jgi:hypothetical protein
MNDISRGIKGPGPGTPFLITSPKTSAIKETGNLARSGSIDWRRWKAAASLRPDHD